jgi:hypothetical protein
MFGKTHLRVATMRQTGPRRKWKRVETGISRAWYIPGFPLTNRRFNPWPSRGTPVLVAALRVREVGQ